MGTVTYIGHSGFFVELDTVCLLFDYEHGSLPEPKDKPLFLFASHSHGDHFNPAIFDYGCRWREARWVLSHDIRPRRVPEESRERTVFLKADTQTELSVPGAVIQISTLRSTDIGVAFLVEVDGKTLYHAGDLHWWLWGENEAEDRQMTRRFQTEVVKLAGKTIDAGFLPLDPRQEGMAFLGLDYYARAADFRRIYPMHCWGEYDIIRRLRADCCSLPYRERICNICGEGQTDEF